MYLKSECIYKYNVAFAVTYAHFNGSCDDLMSVTDANGDNSFAVFYQIYDEIGAYQIPEWNGDTEGY